MSDNDDSLDVEMKMCFIEEGRQLLEDAEQCFLDLESNPSAEGIEKIFRLAHNMKGTSRAVGFGQVAEFTHEFENLLLKIKKNEIAIDTQVVSLLLECNDHLKMMVDGLNANLNATFDSHVLIVKLVSKMSGQMTESVAKSQPATEAMVEASSDDALINPAGLPSDIPTASQFEEEFVPVTKAVPDFVAPAAPAPAKASPAEARSGGGGGDESIRVSLSRLEKLGDFIGELVILQTVLNQARTEIRSELVHKTIGHLGKLSKEIQDISMSLRMIPLKQTFAKLQRIVRDTSKALDKNVELVIDGDQTEVDKTVLEHLGDPLVHIIRNAIDHGLESTADRIAAGKPEIGHVKIAAFHQGNSLVIEIRDDGKGIDPQKLLASAIKKGIVPAHAQMADHDAMMLIFKPGFSSKDEVSEISGRGVGLDVVKTNVERLSGQVQLESELGKGSTFRVILPLTLAIVDAMIVTIAKERYAVPLASIQETVQPRADDVHRVTGQGEILSLRGEPLALFRLRTLLKIVEPAGAAGASSGQQIALIINSSKKPFAVLVDDILRQQQIVIKKLGPEIRQQNGLAGTAILGDGKPALILDMNSLVESPTLKGVA